MVICPNCKIEIEESKLVLHQRFCFQNIRYCEKCEEAIPIDEYDEHLSMHASKQNLSLLKKESKEMRESLCLQKLESSKIGCQYCGLMLSFSDYLEHEEACGSRTQECPDCQNLIMTKDFVDHVYAFHPAEGETSLSATCLMDMKRCVRTNQKKKVNVVPNEEDELLKRACEESLKTYEMEKQKNNHYLEKSSGSVGKICDEEKRKYEQITKKKNLGIKLDENDDKYLKFLEEIMLGEEYLRKLENKK